MAALLLQVCRIQVCPLTCILFSLLSHGQGSRVSHTHSLHVSLFPYPTLKNKQTNPVLDCTKKKFFTLVLIFLDNIVLHRHFSCIGKLELLLQFLNVCLVSPQLMQQLYNECTLVHADLSEYNMLWHAGKVRSIFC